MIALLLALVWCVLSAAVALLVGGAVRLREAHGALLAPPRTPV